MPKLQVFMNNKWEWVFCHNVSRGNIGLCLPENKHKALGGLHNLKWFQNKFGNFSFRLAEKLED